jgi:hypothetical protein
MIHFYLRRDKDSQTTSIKQMSDEPSRDELHEMAKEKIRKYSISLWPGLLGHLRRIKDEKKAGRLEHGMMEHLTVDIPDLLDIVLAPSSQVVDVGYDKDDYWSLTIEGITTLAVTLQVCVRLSRKSDRPLQFASLERIPDF